MKKKSEIPVSASLAAEETAAFSETDELKLQRLENAVRILERLNLGGPGANFLDSKKKVFFLNFVYGLSRGFGFAIGFSILSAVLFVLLRNIVQLHLPVVGDFIAQILYYVEMSMSSGIH